MRSRLAGPDWDLLCEVGIGRSYAEIATMRGGTPGANRVRVLRIRRSLVQEAA
jgi:hypothetical protein